MPWPMKSWKITRSNSGWGLGKGAILMTGKLFIALYIDLITSLIILSNTDFQAGN
jgi:hypothetical protein